MQRWNILSHTRTNDLKRLQSANWHYFVRHLLPFHPFYREMFKEHKLDINSFKDIDDLSKVPFTTKSDLLPTKENPGQSRNFIFQPTESLLKKHLPRTQVLKLIAGRMRGREVKREIEKEFKPLHFHFTTGRTTHQIPFLYTSRDLNHLAETGERIFETIGASRDEVVINAFPFAPHLAFWLGYHAVTKIGLLSLHSGGGKILGTEKIINALEQLKATMLLTTPGYGYHLLREAVRQHRQYPNLKFIIFGGERVSPGLRKKVKEILKQLGADAPQVLSTYGLTEGKTAWVQCHEESGYHLYPDLEHVELVDKNGQRVREGEPGEVVYTALDWRGSVVVRYRTGDICKGLTYSTPCEFCGRTVPRLHYDIERKTENINLDLVKVKGELVNLNGFYTMMHQIPEVEEWQVEIKKKNDDPYDLDELLIHVSLKSDTDHKSVTAIMRDLIKKEMFIGPEIVTHSLEDLIDMLGLERELKEKRIIDRRKH